MELVPTTMTALGSPKPLLDHDGADNTPLVLRKPTLPEIPPSSTVAHACAMEFFGYAPGPDPTTHSEVTTPRSQDQLPPDTHEP